MRRFASWLIVGTCAIIFAASVAGLGATVAVSGNGRQLCTFGVRPLAIPVNGVVIHGATSYILFAGPKGIDLCHVDGKPIVYPGGPHGELIGMMDPYLETVCHIGRPVLVTVALTAAVPPIGWSLRRSRRRRSRGFPLDWTGHPDDAKATGV